MNKSYKINSLEEGKDQDYSRAEPKDDKAREPDLNKEGRIKVACFNKLGFDVTERDTYSQANHKVRAAANNHIKATVTKSRSVTIHAIGLGPIDIKVAADNCSCSFKGPVDTTKLRKQFKSMAVELLQED